MQRIVEEERAEAELEAGTADGEVVAAVASPQAKIAAA
jgi:hypothetical protein